MIQIYKQNNTNYDSNGDMPLIPSDCRVSAELNGAWTISLAHPVDEEGRWKFITEGAVLKVPSFNGDQLFRLKTVTKTDTQVTATGEPIFMDAAGDCFLVDVRPTNDNGQQALDMMTAPNDKYSGQSNITKVSTAYYQFKNLIEAINGDDENSFISRWGGEIFFDNFKIIVNERIGEDNGVEVRYGKNIPKDGFTYEVDMSEVKTRIYPKAYNGYTMTDNGYVDSDLIDSYPTVMAATITFDDVKMAEDATETDEENGVVICNSQAELDEALTEKCEAEFSAGLDKPKVTITVDMIQLSDTEQYKDVAAIETVSLGDTIHCYNSHLGISTEARIVEIEWDCALKRVASVVIGEPAYNYFNSVTSSMNRVDSAIRPDGTVIGEQVAGFINGAMAQLRAQKSVAQKQDVRAVFFEDTDPESPTYGAMAIGTQGLQISRQRNEDGTDWVWTTALTFEGLIANAIVAGIIADKTGESFWNLETGEFVINNGTITSTSDLTPEFTTRIRNGQVISTGLFNIDETERDSYARMDGGTLYLTIIDYASLALYPNGIYLSKEKNSFTVDLPDDEAKLTIVSPLGSIRLVCDKAAYDLPTVEIENEDQSYKTLISAGHLQIVRDGKVIVNY